MIRSLRKTRHSLTCRRTSPLLALSCFIGAAAAADDIMLEEIVVTAEKRTESLQDVPISVSAVSGDMIDKFAIDDIQGINNITPGLAFSRAGGEPQIYIRGIGTASLGVTVDSSVAVHADGVYLGRAQMALGQFLDIDRVEILRGPQGTLYGRNATGGAINVISRKPTAEREGNIRVGFGSFDRREIHGAVGGPLSDTVNYRIAGRSSRDDGFTDDLDARGGSRIDDNDLLALRGIVDIELGERGSLELIAEWSEFESGNRTIRPLDNLGAAEALGALPVPDFDETRNNLPTFYDWDTGGLTATLSWELSDTVALTSVTAYRQYENDFLFNTDGTEIDITRTSLRFDTEQFSQELRLASSGTAALQWLVGLFYLQEDKEGALGLARANTGAPTSFIIPNDNDSEAYAVFGEVSYALSEALTIKGGLRYSREEKDDLTFVGAVPDLDGLASRAAPTFFGSPRDDSQDWDAVTPRLVVEYRFGGDSMIYASVSEGFKSGGWNAFDRNEAFEPEELLSVEVGLKSQWADDRVRFNAAVFTYDYDDLQVNTFIDGLATTTNAATASVHGLEAELTALLSPALTLRAGYAYLDAEYDDFCSPFGRHAAGDALVASGCDPSPAVDATRVLDLSGNTLVNAPENKLNASLEYRRALAAGGELTLFAQATYQDDVFFSQFNEDIVGQEAYTLWDARATYLSDSGQWEVSVFGKNLGDEEYFQNVVRFTSTSDPALDVNGIGNALGYPAAGRTWGLQFGYNF